MLGNAERMSMLKNNDLTHESRRLRILLPKISRAKQLQQRFSSFFGPSLPPDPLTPRRRSPL